MLDQNTDRMWYVIGAVLIGAAIIFGMNTFMPETFASIGGMFEDLIGVVNYDPKREEIEGLIADGYIPVATADELDSIRSATLKTYGKGTEWEDEYEGGLDKQYIQVADVDLSEYSEEGWKPIGPGSSSPFTGTYDGGNYVIRGLVVKGEGKDYLGLFGYTYRATIRNVGLIDNKVIGRSRVGGLVGEANYGTYISNSYATGSVTGERYVGGLVGEAQTSTKISNSYATGSVTASGNYAGGLVGSAGYTTISNSYATGSVEGISWVGGILGSIGRDSTISNSYATGSVTSTSNYAGGLAGDANHDSKISNSYATGLVKGQRSVGGLVGLTQSSTEISKSYWDKGTTGQISSRGGEGKSTNEMKNQATYEGWDFDTVWKINGNDYPKLR